jgi:Short C-terminal domain
MFMRRRPLQRPAAIGGGAHVARKRAARRTAGQAREDDEQNERLLSLEQLSLEQRRRAQGAAGGHAPSMLDQLGRLAALHRQGALTDTEFSAAKAKLLGT